MFICLCHAVTEHDITAAIEDGANSVHALMDTLKVATQCGSCFNEVHAIIESRQSYDTPAIENITAPRIYRKENPPAVTVGG